MATLTFTPSTDDAPRFWGFEEAFPSFQIRDAAEGFVLLSEGDTIETFGRFKAARVYAERMIERGL